MVLGFMPPQHMFFFSNLHYFVLGTLDSRGRPWASILTGEKGFIRPVSQNYLAMAAGIRASAAPSGNISQGYTVAEGVRLVAGLGIDLTNRRRNKGKQPLNLEFKLIIVDGRVSQNMLRIDERELQMIITTDESLRMFQRYCPSILALI